VLSSWYYDRSCDFSLLKEGRGGIFGDVDLQMIYQFGEHAYPIKSI
jgi:hypothetical protein